MSEATPWRGDVGSAPYHLGYFVDDLARAALDLGVNGYAMEVCGVLNGVAPCVPAYYDNADGLRLESVVRTAMGDLSTRFPGHVRVVEGGSDG